MTITLSDVLAAHKRIQGKVIETPVKTSTWLNHCSGASVYLKLENLQITGSFKFRGALNSLQAAKDNGNSVIYTASAGNHGLGVAEAARYTDSNVTVCVPTTVSPAKRRKLSQYNVGLIAHGNDCEITEAYARRMAREKKGYYVSPYNNEEVIAGQGTAALEFLQTVPDLTKLVVAVGGGGLIGGCAVVAKAVNAKMQVIGVVAANSPVMKQCVAAGRIVPVMQDDTIADGIAGNIEPDSITFPMAQELVDSWVAVEERDIRETVFDFLAHEGMLVEGAAAAAVAAVKNSLFEISPADRVGIIICGGNIAEEVWQDILLSHLQKVTT